MQKIGFKFDSTDINCIFYKFKIFEDYDALSLKTLENQLQNIKEKLKIDYNQNLTSKFINNEILEEDTNIKETKEILDEKIGDKKMEINNISKISSTNLENNEKILEITKNRIMDNSLQIKSMSMDMKDGIDGINASIGKNVEMLTNENSK